jgi:ribosomal protein L16 Arg81 hydroxylase/catechol 2,3-dioxygenase-like lactoylglutathione lyase family enzyme
VTIVSGEEARQLLFPISPQSFLEQYWQRRPLFIRGTPEKFQRLFDWDRFHRALEDHENRGIGIRVSFDNVSAPGQMSTHLPISAADVPLYLERGASVCADPIDRGDASLADFAAKVARQLQYVGGVSVKAYASPDGCGFNTHFDKGIATTLQIDGKKRWRYSTAPAVFCPTDNALVTPGGGVRYVGRTASSLASWERVEDVDQSSFDEVTLEPGDVLCLPAGTWHNAKAIGRSLALNLSFQPLDVHAFLSFALGGLLKERPDWRRGLPPAYSDAALNEPPASVTAFLGARLAELQQLLQDPELVQQKLQDGWRELVSDPGTAARQSAAFITIPAALREADGAPARNAWQVDPSPVPPPTQDAAETTPAFAGRMTCTICVRRLDRAIAFYEGVLGFRLLFRVDALSWCELASPVANVTIGLSEVEHPENRGGVVLTLHVNDLEATRRRLEDLGVTFDGPTRVIQKAVKLAAFFDPDGTRLILSEALT